MTRLLFDGNSELNTALLGGIDHDQGRVVTGDDGKDIQVNSAQYGVDKFFDRYCGHLTHFSRAPRETILTWDGRNAKLRRRTFLPNYKVGRDKHPAISEQLNIAKDMVSDMLLKLGAHVVQQDGMEGDDVLGYLSRTLRTQRNIVITGDGDMSVLVDDNTDVWRLGELNKNPYGPFPHRFITLYKALVGDNKDKIPGAKGFGDAKWVELVRTFGLDGLELMEDLVKNDQLHKLREDIDSMPNLKLIIDSKEQVAVSWRAASLMVDEVNTIHKQLDWRAGMAAQWSELDDSMRVHELKHFYGTKTLVTAANYDKAKAGLAARMAESPFVGLDIETSSSEESDEWIERLNSISEKSRGDKIDVLGHELTGMSLTFGANTQHTIYMSVDHVDTDNITVDQCREMVEVIPQRLNIIIQNRQFEFSVLYRTWGEKWMQNGWHGFVPNALDTKVGGAYVDENLLKGLKFRSKHHLGYDQETYAQVTTISGPAGTLKGGRVVKSWEKELEPAEFSTAFRQRIDPDTGEITQEEYPKALVCPAVTETWESRQLKMNELPATRVVNYGCDDTIVTCALHTHYQLIMELEHTWQTYLDVETLPEYLTSLAFVQGFNISLEKLVGLEKKDDEAYEKAWQVFRGFLLSRGWAGSVCPTFTEMTPAAVKEAAAILVDTDEVQFTTKKRKLDGMAMDLRAQFPGDENASLMAHFVEKGDLTALNGMIKATFTGEPKINFGSPKQMQDLLFNHLGVQPRLLNRMTDKQKEDNPVMAGAFKKRRTAKDLGVDLFTLTEPIKVGRKSVDPLTAEERTALISKATTDDDAVLTALAKDPLTDEARSILKALQTIKTVQTRRSLFYKTYRVIPHWRDGRVHPSLNQSEAVTLRYSSSTPNVQQMPKRGEGKAFRQIVLPHHSNAVVGSEDFAGQELRLMGEFSGDENLTACFVGDNLKDVHSLTAVAASIYLWDAPVDYPTFQAMRKMDDSTEEYLKAKTLRENAKTVNFGTQYDMQAEKLSVALMVDEETAQKFIDAKAAAFPGMDPWKESVRESVNELGYATTMLGARRHLRAAMQSTNRAEAGKVDRQGPNFKIQASAAEMSKLAMAEAWRRGIFTGRYDARFIAPIHDELVFSVGRQHAAEVCREVNECMTQQYAQMKIPIVSSISIGANFGQQIECGDEFNEEAINDALMKIFA